MRILHTSDWHIGQFNGPVVNGENARFLDICKCLDALVNEAVKQQPDIIVIAGDIFHQARVWSDRGLKESQTAIGYIRKLEKIAPVVILRGTPNHDSAEQFKMLETSFAGDASVRISTTPEVIDLYTYGGARCSIAMLPGFDRGYFRAKMPGLDKSQENEIFTQHIDTLIKGLKAQCGDDCVSILVTHYTVEGANMESGQTAFFSQFEPCVYLPTLQSASFDLNLFGHIHRPQKLDGCDNAFYCGAVSALNFNDEGQERGFYIHDVSETTKEVTSSFFALPTREFCTLRFEDKDIADFVASGNMLLNTDIDGKIVRVIYNCTDEHNKALNKTLMEQMLYERGAFWVQEITPNKIEVTVNKSALKDDNTPEDNLKSYLVDKGIDDADIVRIATLASPIISEAVEKNLTLKTTGAFVPVEIEVKNYRNYREEKFNFDGIRFCTINGENGAGKSSLFMDAMCDCLFEETREGDLAGWISNAADARSGSIIFTFKMGDALYRVTRTRMKSGKATLNLSEMVDGEWTDRSCEKMKDTQQEILNTIGMDSLTLKATALIMQDQYGLFLTADKDARMTILGNILGLGAYDDMYSMASTRATDVNRDIRALKDKTAILLDGVKDDAEIESEIASVQSLVENLNAQKKDAAERANSLLLAASMIDEAEKRIEAINAQIVTTNGRKATATSTITSKRGVIMVADDVISKKAEVEASLKEYRKMTEREKELLEVKAKSDSLTEKVLAAQKELDEANASVAELHARRQLVIAQKLKPAEKLLEREKELLDAHDDYVATSERLSKMDEVRAAYNDGMTRINEAKFEVDKARKDKEAGVNERKIKIAALQRRAELLEKSDCKYAEEVHCTFLKDAIEAKSQIDDALAELDSFRAGAEAAVESAERALNDAKAALVKDYSPLEENALREVLRSLEASEKEYVSLSVARAEKQNAEEIVNDYYTRIEQQRERVANAEAALKAVEADRDALADALTEFTEVESAIKRLSVYLEIEKKIPVAEEQKQEAEIRIAELESDIAAFELEVAKLEKERSELKAKTLGGDILHKQYEEAKAEVNAAEKNIQDAYRQIGDLERVQTEVAAKREQAAELMRQTDAKSQEANDLEILKQAFSQDGIPHNIVRSIVPVLEATATNILGQMSGGKMSVEFVMEKTLKSNSKKEVTALDIVINDAVTGRLPYMSRSGGERVKSALAVILALAEVKSTKAGVQLGFLFIDEPPFLDDKGVQAYCDALEAIQTRYSELKVMAITHDPEMKSRFPQSVDVVKTQDGSKIIYS